MRQRGQEFEENPDLVRGIIAEGCEKARAVAGQTLDDVKQAMGLGVPLRNRHEQAGSQADRGWRVAAAAAPENHEQAEMPFAVVEGEPLTEMPRDLYIPPDALQVFLEAFEGPLDLLLYLIRRQNLDILDIPLAEITRQYMQYIEVMQELQLELAGEYMLMAATLAEIKSRMLLPRPQGEGDEEDDDPARNWCDACRSTSASSAPPSAWRTCRARIATRSRCPPRSSIGAS